MLKKSLLTLLLIVSFLLILPINPTQAQTCTIQSGTYTQAGLFTSAQFNLAAGEGIAVSIGSNFGGTVDVQFIGLAGGVIGSASGAGGVSTGFSAPANDTYTVTINATAGSLVTFAINGGNCPAGGSAYGAACNGEEYNNFNVVKIFRQSNGTYNVFGNCTDNSCREVASINPNAFVTIDYAAPQGSTFRAFQSAGSGGWFARAYPVAPDGGARVYQVNVYDAGSSLRDDGYWIYVYPDNTTAWKARLCPLSGRIAITATSVQPSTVVVTTPVPATTTTTTTQTTPVLTSSNQRSPGDSGPRERAMGTFANGVYTVAVGDNLYRISLRFGISMQAIMVANNLSNANLIYAGQRLVIP